MDITSFFLEIKARVERSDLSKGMQSIYTKTGHSPVLSV